MSNRNATLRALLHPWLSCAVVAFVLAGCGAEVAGGAAAVGSLQAAQAKEAKAQQQRIVEEMKAAQEAGMTRAASAAE